MAGQSGLIYIYIYIYIFIFIYVCSPTIIYILYTISIHTIHPQISISIGRPLRTLINMFDDEEMEKRGRGRERERDRERERGVDKEVRIRWWVVGFWGLIQTMVGGLCTSSYRSPT